MLHPCQRARFEDIASGHGQAADRQRGDPGTSTERGQLQHHGGDRDLRTGRP